jgi:hypothetical protein
MSKLTKVVIAITVTLIMSGNLKTLADGTVSCHPVNSKEDCDTLGGTMKGKICCYSA